MCSLNNFVDSSHVGDVVHSGDDEKIENRVNNTIDWSMYISQNLFTSKASNAIRSEAELYEFE